MICSQTQVHFFSYLLMMPKPQIRNSIMACHIDVFIFLPNRLMEPFGLSHGSRTRIETPNTFRQCLGNVAVSWWQEIIISCLNLLKPHGIHSSHIPKGSSGLRIFCSGVLRKYHAKQTFNSPSWPNQPNRIWYAMCHVACGLSSTKISKVFWFFAHIRQSWIH